ncbi:MAG TPA: HD-GYP domain-containing protein [Rectinemataceae bacterium]|nr:HD-GYP domain-containing protein [Rectinemataceae bacterium]
MDELRLSEEPEELEELEELEAPEDFELLERGVNALPSESPLLTESGPRSAVRSYARLAEPLALLDDSFGFVYRNPPFSRLLKAFGYPDSSSFLGTLSRAIDKDKAKEIHESLSSEERSHSWKGTVSHKAKNSAAVITKVHIFPLFAEAPRDRSPEAYSVYLDDVTEENRKILRDMFSSLLEASKLKDNDTGRHIERVNLYSSRLATELFNDPRWPEVDQDFIDNLGFLAAMHDVGKIGTPDDILNKVGPLNEFEWKLMKEHTLNGAFILSSYPNPMAKEIALSHHEWWNGSGYPFNLEGRMIPLSARIVTVADVYDALRMKRSYKPAYPHDVAIEKIRQEKGVHFDPGLIDMLARVEADFAEIFAANADS